MLVEPNSVSEVNIKVEFNHDYALRFRNGIGLEHR